MPKVTVIIPNYNHGRFLEQRIRTILDQTYQDFEVIYLDDASTDNSGEVFAAFAGNDRIRSICNEKNSGSPFIQWNKGIKEARGEYIWIAESDDYADLKLLQTLVRQLDVNPKVGIAYCQSQAVDQAGEMGGSYDWWTSDLDPARWGKDFVNDGEDECARYLIRKNTIPNASGVVFRKSVYEKAGYSDESMRLSGDWMVWVKMLLISDVAFVSEPLNYFRKHTNSVRHATGGVILEERYRIAEYIRARTKVPPEIIEQVRNDAASMWLYPVLKSQSTISLARHRQIWRTARAFDHRILRRLAAKTGRHYLNSGYDTLRSLVRGRRLQKARA